MFGKNKKQTATTTVDPQTQQYVQGMRQQAQEGASQIAGGQFFGGPTQTFMQGINGLQNLPQTAQALFNPYQQQVVNAAQSDFDRQRAAALTAGAQAATRAGAFGGSRSGVLQAQALRDVNQNEASTLANLRYGGYNTAMSNAMAQSQGLLNAGYTQGQLQDQVRQNPVYAYQNALQLQNLGLGPYGQTSTQVAPGGGGLGGAAKGALGGAAIGSVIPGIGTLAGGIIGGLGGLFG